MKTRKITLLVVVLATLAPLATACNKTDSSANANVNSPAGKNSNSSSGTSSAASKRFVGTWTEEGEKNDKGTRFTADGKVIEVSTGKQVPVLRVPTLKKLCRRVESMSSLFKFLILQQ